MKQPAVYLMTNFRNGTLYVGATSNLVKRVYEHREGYLRGFTQRHGCKRLVFYELHANMRSALEREKQIKGGSRRKKLEIIEKNNPYWLDLFLELY